LKKVERDLNNEN